MILEGFGNRFFVFWWNCGEMRDVSLVGRAKRLPYVDKDSFIHRGST
ncbi:hypothetical protein [Primorskyibacter sedentarius]|nr:hypothetical protein [Primorskyibacter sedentarius]